MSDGRFEWRTQGTRIMSLRRKSCDACFQGRRKCDLTFPTCQRCRKTGKICQYVMKPTSVASGSSSSTKSAAMSIGSNGEIYLDGDATNSEVLQRGLTEDPFLATDLQYFNFDLATQESTLTVPNLLGELGSLSSLHGDIKSWRWVAAQLQECPRRFAKAGENMFIHPSMYRLRTPPVIKTAFGLCTASQMVTPATNPIFTSSLEGEARMLLNDTEMDDVPRGLARLQAMLIYQILRLLGGDSTQRRTAEEQKGTMNAWALRLLQKVPTDSLHPSTYEDFVVFESMRRTVMTIFILHGLGSISKHGVCTELPTLALLPVSVDSDPWESSNGLSTSPAGGDLGTMKYGEWANMWVGLPPRRRLDPFQRMLMVACKGQEKVEELEFDMIEG